MIIAIDPGPRESALIAYDANRHKVLHHYYESNAEILQRLDWLDEEFPPLIQPDEPKIIIEMIGHYGTGMPAGKSVFDTCVWIGRFIQAASRWEIPIILMLRKSVTAQLCNSAKAKDANVRQACIDRFEPVGGGATPQIGIKSDPGPLYGLSGDKWQALGLALAYAEGGEVIERIQ